MKPTLLMSGLLLWCSTAFAQTKSETATVHIYRNHSMLAWLHGYKVKINGKKVKIKDASSYDIAVPAGETEFKLVANGRSRYKINTEAGKEYYMKLYIRAGILGAKPELAEVTPGFANVQTQKIKTTRKHSEVVLSY